MVHTSENVLLTAFTSFRALSMSLVYCERAHYHTFASAFQQDMSMLKQSTPLSPTRNIHSIVKSWHVLCTTMEQRVMME